jgi:hypothetical protein
MEKTGGFSYEPLASSRAIRLLKFRAGPHPTCQMITVEVEKAPPYAALSYTWGSKTLSRTIGVDGAEVPITVNLADAIDAIFLFARSRNLVFWADSICINQADIHERSRQVRLMNTIYRSAEFVVVWLGLAEPDNDLAFDKMEEWKARLDTLKQQFHGSEYLPITSISPHDPVFFGPRGSIQHRAVEALRMIYRRPWWTRAWIVQEGTMVNPMRTILFCGNRSADWTHFRVALQLTHDVKLSKTFGISNDFHDGMAIRLDAFRQERELGASIGLLRVLGLIRSYDCEDLATSCMQL